MTVDFPAPRLAHEGDELPAVHREVDGTEYLGILVVGEAHVVESDRFDRPGDLATSGVWLGVASEIARELARANEMRKVLLDPVEQFVGPTRLGPQPEHREEEQAQRTERQLHVRKARRR